MMTRRDGLDPAEVYAWSGPLQRLGRDFFSLVTAPAWLARARSGGAPPSAGGKTQDAARARAVLASTLSGLRSSLRRLEPKRPIASAWTGYMEHRSHYSDADFAAKERFVQQAVAEFSPGRVLDIGCNTGHFSLLAAELGASVVAIDSDPAALTRVWESARKSLRNILPLAVDLTRPTPAMGWRNQECPAFLDRARGAFDMVLMLAVLHHIIGAERVPLTDVLRLAAELTRGVLILEFIPPEDPMFRRIVLGREALYSGLDREAFEQACRRDFDVVRAERLGQSPRWLYLLRRR